MADAPLLREEDFGFDPAYRIELPMFDGPLDLLLYLIRKHKIDIYDIPISLITEKYLAYIDQMKELDVDVASEFLVMAAELIHIKSRMLLPQIEEPGEEGEDPRAELVRRLLEYQAIKEAAVALADLDLLNRDVFVHPADRSLLPEPEDGGIKEIDLVELLKAFRRVLARAPIERHQIKAEHYHVKDRMKELAVRLSGSERISFDDVFEASTPRSRAWFIVTFLAVLELVRLKMLKIVQAEQFATIHLLPQNNLSTESIDGAQIDWDLPKASEEAVPDTAQEALPLEEPASEPEAEEAATSSEDSTGPSDDEDELDNDEEDWDEDEEDELEYDLEDTGDGEKDGEEDDE